MIWRLLILLLLTRAPAIADGEQDITDVVSTLASALSANNPQQFLKALDPQMPGYRQIEHDLNALADQNLVSCSVDLIANSSEGAAQKAELDWYMSIRSQQDENLFERRRAKVTIKIEKRGKKWLVTYFSPLTIFAPMQAR